RNAAPSRPSSVTASTSPAARSFTRCSLRPQVGVEVFHRIALSRLHVRFKALQRKPRGVLQADVEAHDRLQLTVVADQPMLADVVLDQIELGAQFDVASDVAAADRVEVARTQPDLAQNPPSMV